MKSKMLFKISALFVVLVFMTITLVFIAQQRKKIEMSSIIINFDDTYRFVTQAQIESIIQQNFGNLNGALLDTINTYRIKQKIEENPWVHSVAVFKGYNRHDSLFVSGSLRVVVKHEDPLFRIIENGKSVYVGQNGKELPASDTYTLNVPVLTGTFSDSLLQNSMLPFVKYISADEFLKSLILQMHVSGNQELVLIPRVGNHKIEFGKVDDFEKKFRNLKAVYEQGFGNDEWEKYKTVSLKYNNQVICSLK